MLNTPSAEAAGSTLLPTLSEGDWPDCDPDNPEEWELWEFIFAYDQDQIEGILALSTNDERGALLACAMKTGHLKFWMVKYFIVYMLEFIISLAGLISVLMIIVGAYFYIAGGLTDDKEKGKNIIKYAIGGLVLTTLAWVLVNIVLLGLST